MKKEQLSESILTQLKRLFPENFSTLKEDLNDTIRAAINKAVTECDLVTQAEFDAQAKVLAKTREKVEALTTQVVQLEQQLTAAKPAADKS